LFVLLGTISEKPMQPVSLNNIEMFHDDFWKNVYFVVKRSKVKVISHKNIGVVGLCTLVSAGFF